MEDRVSPLAFKRISEKEGFEHMRKFLRVCENALTNLSLASIFLIMILTTIDTVGRYVLHLPIRGAYEFIQDYLMVSAVFFGICYAYRGDGFISIDLLVARLPRQAKITLNYFSQVCCILLTFIFVWATIKRCLRSIALVENMPLVWNLPLWPAYAVIPVGLFFAALVMILDLWGVKKKSAP